MMGKPSGAVLIEDSYIEGRLRDSNLAKIHVPMRIPTKSAADSERMRPPLGAERRTLSKVTQSWPTSGFFASRLRIDSPFNVIL